jgi:hypothetical protein
MEAKGNVNQYEAKKKKKAESELWLRTRRIASSSSSDIFTIVLKVFRFLTLLATSSSLVFWFSGPVCLLLQSRVCKSKDG